MWFDSLNLSDSRYGSSLILIYSRITFGYLICIKSQLAEPSLTFSTGPPFLSFAPFCVPLNSHESQYT